MYVIWIQLINVLYTPPTATYPVGGGYLNLRHVNKFPGTVVSMSLSLERYVTATYGLLESQRLHVKRFNYIFSFIII